MPDYLSKVVWEKAEDHEYNIPFSFLDSSHVKVKASGVLLTTDDYTISGTTVTITGSYGDGDVIIYRETPGSTQATRNTPENQYVDFANGSVITEADLDNSSLQSIYVAQEAMDKALDAEATPGASGNVPEPDASQDKYILTADGVAVSSVWSSTSDVQTILNVDSAHTASTIPIRDAATPPKILTDVTGDVIGDLTGNADTSTALETSRTFKTTGDVTTASAIGFTGIANVDMVTTVDKINGVDVTTAVTADDGKVLTYNHGSTQWEPVSSPPAKAVISVKATGEDDGQSIVKEDWRHVYLPSGGLIMNEGAGITITNGATDGYITLIEGNWQVAWNQVFGIDMQTCFTRLVKDDDTGFPTPTVIGVGTVTRSSAAGNVIATSTGFARFNLAGTRHIRLEVYAEENGLLGHNTSGFDNTDGYCFTLITITKE